MTGIQGNQTAQGPKHKRNVTRRKVVVAGGAAVAAVGVGGTIAATANAYQTKKGASPTASSTSSETCYKLTSETTEGPYYIDADKLRQDITEDREGIPLTLRLKVIDNETCKPIRNAAVDIWHCDALGLYSGYEDLSSGGGGGGTPPSGTPTDVPSGTPTGSPPAGGGGGGHEEPTDDKRYLRGTWKTDKQGFVTFKTVFPGWYRGRCVHIHTKVHVSGTWTDMRLRGWQHLPHRPVLLRRGVGARLGGGRAVLHVDDRAHDAHRGHHLRPVRHGWWSPQAQVQEERHREGRPRHHHHGRRPGRDPRGHGRRGAAGCVGDHVRLRLGLVVRFGEASRSQGGPGEWDPGPATPCRICSYT